MPTPDAKLNPRKDDTVRALLSVEQVQVAYRGAVAVHGVSLRVRPGEIVTMVGPNGAGKSSTLRAISGFTTAEVGRVVGGRVLFEGRDVTRKQPGQTTQEGLRLVPERNKVFVQLTVEENLRVSPRSSRQKATQLAFEIFPELDKLRKRKAGYLSGGEKQMLAIAMALQSTPKVMLVDELSLGLAPWLAQDIMQRVKRINVQAGVSFLLVEQNVRAVSRITDHMYVLNDGQVANTLSGNELSMEDLVGKYLPGF